MFKIKVLLEQKRRSRMKASKVKKEELILLERDLCIYKNN